MRLLKDTLMYFVTFVAVIVILLFSVVILGLIALAIFAAFHANFWYGLGVCLLMLLVFCAFQAWHDNFGL